METWGEEQIGKGVQNIIAFTRVRTINFNTSFFNYFFYYLTKNIPTILKEFHN